MVKADIEDGSSSDGHETAKESSERPSVWNRFGRHFKRWWWLYLVAFCCLFLIIFLPIIYVGIPHFANDYINNHEFSYEGLAITNPGPHSFQVTQFGSLNLGGGLTSSGHLTAFNASLRVPATEKEFAVFPFPRIEFGYESTLNIDHDVDISCVECFSDLAVAAVTNENFGLLVTGHPGLKLGAFPTAHLDIHKLIQMKGTEPPPMLLIGTICEHYETKLTLILSLGFNTTGFLSSNGNLNIIQLSLMSPAVNGFNVNATIAMRTAIGFTVEMGHVTFNLTLNGSKLGYLDVPNLKLEPDHTSAVVLGYIDESMLIREFIWGNGDGANVVIGFKGHGCDYNGVEIPYFAAAIKAIDASVTVNLLQYIGLLK
ncbi:hypothetical protein N7539_001668 [Penicillium diatomitis]|uniref:Uncharacterized protein n=1 Tax=Penicillium diatomitis TaxID=2819901 RepID=A0A9X0BZV3_9EURO|nr:uncharacterized protein N7539_001668 [Penicillium diatomitis]KAJ5492922.1 hypothetical protein N7539_001668 [Penicillium diatomitis]